jgi:hypothetical protein
VTDTGIAGKKVESFDWLAVVFYPLAVVLMEAFWVYPWLVWVGNWPAFAEKRPGLSLASVVIVLGVSLLVTRLTLRMKWPLWLIRGTIIGGGVVVMLLVLGVDYNAGYVFLSGGWFAHVGQLLGTTLKSPSTIVLSLPAMVYLWWRGINLGQTTSYFRDIYRSFLLGMVALVILVIIWQVSAASDRFKAPGAEIGWNVMAFFFFGLLAIAISHIYVMRRSMPKEEAALTSVRRWLPMVLGVIGGMVLVGFGVASIFSAAMFESIGHGADIVFHFLGKVIDYVLIPLNYVFDFLFKVLQYLVSLIRSNQPLQPGQSGNMTIPGLNNVVPKEMPPWVTDALRWFVIAIVVAVIIFILAKAISRLRGGRRGDEIEEIHESLFSWRGLRDDLRELFNMMGNRFKRKPPAPSPYQPGENVPGRLDIREIFRHLQWEGSRSGLPRRRQETAAEYTRRLERAVPESTGPLTGINDLYAVVRYGETSVPEERVDSANGLWRTLRGLLRKIRGA